MDSKQIIAELRQALNDFDDFRANAIECALLEPERIELSRAASRIEGAMTAAADLLESDGWVSVEERLPETREPVMAYLAVGRIAIAQWHKPFWDEDGRVVNVTHWRPLPTPPGGDHD